MIQQFHSWVCIGDKKHTHQKPKTDICTPVFTAALFTIAKIWKQPQANKRMDKLNISIYLYTYMCVYIYIYTHTYTVGGSKALGSKATREAPVFIYIYTWELPWWLRW